MTMSVLNIINHLVKFKYAIIFGEPNFKETEFASSHSDDPNQPDADVDYRLQLMMMVRL